MPDSEPQQLPSSMQLDESALANQPKAGEEKMALVPSLRETFELTKTNRGWKFHCLIAFAIAAASWATWFFVDWFSPHYPWFIWVWGTCLMSLTFHYYLFVRPRQHYNLHLAWFTIINTNLMLTWLCTDTAYMWWIVITLSWGHLLNLHYQISPNKADKNRYIKMHQISFALLHAMLFFIWVQTSRDFPWFLIVFLATAVLYLIHHCLHYHPKNYVKLHTYLFADTQLLLFVIWAATGPSVPWFVFPLAGWGTFLFIHMRLAKNRVPLLPQTAQDVPKPVSTEDSSQPAPTPASQTEPAPQQTDSPQVYGSMYPALHDSRMNSIPAPSQSPYPYMVTQPPVYIVPVQAPRQQ